VYIDFMLRVADENGKKTMTSMQTQTALKRSNIAQHCTEERIAANIEDIIGIDIFLGLAGNESDFDASLVQSLDVTRQQAATVLKRDISSKESNVMTVVVKGGQPLFSQQYAREYTLAVEDVVSLHFLNLDKKGEVEQLIAAGKAFTTENMLFKNKDFITSMRLTPTEALLDICPLQARRGVYGCSMRREIRQRHLEFKTNSVVSLTGRLAEDEIYSHMRAGLWSPKNFGGSQYAKQLGYNHSKIIRDRYALNSRYTKGFLISPTFPWRQTELDTADETAAVLDLAQYSITTILLALDTNIGQEFEASVTLTLHLRLALSEAQIIQNQLLIAASYALGSGLDPENCYIDSSIQEIEGTAGRRLLQASVVGSDFDMIVGFARQDEDEAVEEAKMFREEVSSETSTVMRSIINELNIAIV